MSEELKKPAVSKKAIAGADAFRKRRSCARKRAAQFLFGLDLARDWQYTPEGMANFKEMLPMLEEDSETLSPQDFEKAAEYLETLVKGVVENLDAIDGKIRTAARNWRLERMSPMTRCILRVATYEIGYVENVSAATAINEAVELSKAFDEGDMPRFINGVLDRVRRAFAEPEASEPTAAEAPAAEAPAEPPAEESQTPEEPAE